MGQLENQCARRVRHFLDDVGDGGPHPHGFVRDQRLQRLLCLHLQLRLRVGGQAGCQTGQLPRQQDAHPLVTVAGQGFIHLRRCRRIHRQRSPNRDRFIGCQVLQQFGRRRGTCAKADPYRLVGGVKRVRPRRRVVHTVSSGETRQ